MLSRLFGPRTAPYLAMAEYWVYLKEPTAPSQDAMMSRMIAASPYAKGSVAPIGPKEGVLWSDVRFHMALALREKNAHIFRPDLFEAHVEPTAEMLESLSEATALLKLRYVSEHELADNRHLQFLVYAVEAAAHLSGSKVAFDLVGERIFTPKWLQEGLAADPDGSRKDLHLRTIWRPGASGGTAETRGLQKIGLQELCTPETMPDHRVVALEVLDRACDRIWESRRIEPEMIVESFGDSFHVLIDLARKGPFRTRILREKH